MQERVMFYIIYLLSCMLKFVGIYFKFAQICISEEQVF